MPKYRIEETVPSWVTWTREIDAESAEAAEALFREGVGAEQETAPTIGDAIDCLDVILTVEEMTGGTGEIRRGK